MTRIHPPHNQPAVRDHRPPAETGAAATRSAASGHAGAPSLAADLGLALTYERLAITLYYTGLTAPAVMRDHHLAGPSANPQNPGLPPGGNPANVRILQAALDAEVKHAQALTLAGAAAAATPFYFPASTFHQRGSIRDPRTFLGVVYATERSCVGMYLALLNRLFQLHQRDLAQFVTQVLGVESEHRMLSRVIEDVDPANNLTIEDAPFATLSDARTALQPYLTGRGLPGGATRAVTLPTTAQTARVIGRHGTHVVTRFR